MSPDELGGKSAKALATWFGCGASPVAPGTVGSVAAVPLHFALRALGPVGHWAAIAALGAVGTWAADRTARDLGEEDPQSVVIDEVVGMLLALAALRRQSVKGTLIAFGLFRLLDIVKPGPIDGVQRLRPAGVGIMADDVLAGIGAGLLARVLTR